MKSHHRNTSSDLVKLLSIHKTYSILMFKFTEKYIYEFGTFTLSQIQYSIQPTKHGVSNLGLHPLLSWLLAVGPCHHLINKQFLREELPTVLRPYARGWGVVQKGRHYLSLHTVYNHGSFPQKQSMSYATHCKKKQKLKFPSILSTLYLEVV